MADDGNNAISLEMVYLMLQERHSQYQMQFAALEKSITAALTAIREVIAGQEKATDTALTAAKEAIAAALSAVKEATAKAATAYDERFKSMNEFRGTLSDQALGFMTRTEADIRFKALETSLNHISQLMAQGTGKIQGAQALWAAIGGIVLLVVGVGTFIMNYVAK